MTQVIVAYSVVDAARGTQLVAALERHGITAAAVAVANRPPRADLTSALATGDVLVALCSPLASRSRPLVTLLRAARLLEQSGLQQPPLVVLLAPIAERDLGPEWRTGRTIPPQREFAATLAQTVRALGGTPDPALIAAAIRSPAPPLRSPASPPPPPYTIVAPLAMPTLPVPPVVPVVLFPAQPLYKEIGWIAITSSSLLLGVLALMYFKTGVDFQVPYEGEVALVVIGVVGILSQQPWFRAIPEPRRWLAVLFFSSLPTLPLIFAVWLASNSDQVFFPYFYSIPFFIGYLANATNAKAPKTFAGRAYVEPPPKPLPRWAPRSRLARLALLGGLALLVVAGTLGTALLHSTTARWSIPFSASFGNVLAASGTMLLAQSDTLLIAFDAHTGARHWSFDDGAQFGSLLPVAFGNGVVYVGAAGGLAALDLATGAPRWQNAAVPSADEPPAVSNGMVYVADNGLTALDAATGALRWSVAPAGDTNLDRFPLVAGNGLVVAAGANTLYALDAATGALRWSHPVAANELFSQLALAGGLVIVGMSQAKAIDDTPQVLALDAASGAVRWHAGNKPQSVYSLVATSDVVIFSQGDSDVFAVDARTGAARWHFASGGILGGFISGLAVAGNRVYVAGDTVTALAASDGGTIWTYVPTSSNNDLQAIAASSDTVFVWTDNDQLLALRA